MVLKFVTSQRNKQLLLHNNYLYNMQSCSDAKVIWRCIAYTRSVKCMCRVHTSTADKHGVILWESDFDHTHIVEVAEINALKVKAKIKKDALKSSDNPSNIIDKRAHNIHAFTSFLLPTSKSLCRTI
ncbi:hypothetical protein TKK_0009863 [Trichogramma kaykai]